MMPVQRRTYIALGVLVLTATAAHFVLAWEALPGTFAPSPTATSTPSEAGTTGKSTHDFGEATIALNEVASFPNGISIRPTSVLEDSRCPVDVQCIQAGRVRLSVRVNTGNDAREYEFSTGSSIQAGNAKITLESVAPEKRKDAHPSNTDYRFTFKVENLAPPPPESQPCYVGGCSSQLCTDTPGVMSSCIFRPEYACYQGATCERQPTGQCGWTPTPELLSCLANPPGNVQPNSRGGNHGATTTQQ